jgi:hypothetical protein
MISGLAADTVVSRGGKVRTMLRHRRARRPDDSAERTQGTAADTGETDAPRERHEREVARGDVPGENERMKDVWWVNQVTGPAEGEDGSERK